MVVAHTNCNPQADQRCCGGNDSLEAQQRFAQITNLTFVASERQMYEAMDTEHYRYILMLRESEARYRSHWQHVYRNAKGVPRFARWWEGQPDNWNFRNICGTQCTTVAKYRITQPLFDYTLDRLLHFDHFLFLERFNESFTALADAVGWNIMPVRVHRSSQNFHYSPDQEGDEWDPMMSALDRALYEIASRIFDGRNNNQTNKIDARWLSGETQKGVDAYFRTGASMGCVTACCNTTCSKY